MEKIIEFIPITNIISKFVKKEKFADLTPDQIKDKLAMLEASNSFMHFIYVIFAIFTAVRVNNGKFNFLSVLAALVFGPAYILYVLVKYYIMVPSVV